MGGSKRGGKSLLVRGAVKARRAATDFFRLISGGRNGGAKRRTAKGGRKLSPAAKVFIVAPLAVASVASLALASMLVFYTFTIPDPLSLRTKVSGQPIRILARDGSVLAERGTAHDFIPLEFSSLSASSMR